jgi:hypothetical protein
LKKTNANTSSYLYIKFNIKEYETKLYPTGQVGSRRVKRTQQFVGMKGIGGGDEGKGKGWVGGGSPEAEFLDVMGTKVLLAIHNHLC